MSEILPEKLLKSANNLCRKAKEKSLSLTCAESCTGGLLSSILTDIEGLSHVFERGFVVYSNAAKCDLLGLEPALVDRCDAVSREVAEAMARGALQRSQADIAVANAAEEAGTVWIPPFNHPDIVAGQGTAAVEALEDAGKVDAIFAPCGGGGLLSGTLLTARALQPDALVIGAEPLAANDASQSLQQGEIVALDAPPVTLADGAATPSVGNVTFPLLQELDDFYEVDELQIAYWTQWLQHLLKLHIEPTCAMSMAAVAAWAANTPPGQTALVMLSGGNISQASMAAIWERDFLLQPPIINTEE